MAKTRRSAAFQPQEPQSALAQDIRDQASEIADEIAALLADLPDEQLFGNTELLIRDKVLKLVAGSLAAKLDQKKRLPRLQHRLPPVRPNRRVPRLPGAKPLEYRRRGALQPGLLPVPVVRSRLLPV